MEALREIPEVKEGYTVYGVYDIIARVEGETMLELKDVIDLQIRHQDNIRSTLTMTGI